MSTSQTLPTDPPQAPPMEPAAGMPPRRWPLAPLSWALLGLMALLLGSVLAAWLALRSQAGTTWLVPRLPGVTVQGLSGALLGPALSVQQLTVRWPSGSVQIDGARLEGLRLTLLPRPGSWISVQAQNASAEQVWLRFKPSDKPFQAPKSIGFPVDVAVADVDVRSLRFGEGAPLTDIRGATKLNLDEGRSLQASGLRFAWGGMRFAGDARVATATPFEATATATAEPVQGRPWAAQASARGPLLALPVQLMVKGPALVPGEAALSVDATLRLNLVSPWPLRGLQLRSEALDLAALHPALPHTRLRGSVDMESEARERPPRLLADLTNTLPGRWSEQRLPLQSLKLNVQTDGLNPQRIDVQTLQAELGGPRVQAGRVLGSGRWEGPVLDLALQLQGVRPQQLDERLAAMSLAGPLRLRIDGLPAPGRWTEPGSGWTLRMSAQQQGLLDGAGVGGGIGPGQSVQVQLEADASAGNWRISSLRAQAAAASAELSASGRAMGSGRWQWRSEGALRAFDPLPWWPGRDGSAWRKGPHRLNGQWRFDVQTGPAEASPGRPQPAAVGKATPAEPAASQFWTYLSGLRGEGQLSIRDSVLAGVSVAAELSLEQDQVAPAAIAQSGGGAAAELSTTLRGDLRIGQNQLRLQARGKPSGDGRSDRAQAELDAPALAELAPLLALAPALAADVPSAGRASATMQSEGRWPELRSSGQARASGLRSSRMQLADASLGWQFDTRQVDEALRLRAELRGLQLRAGQSLEQGVIDLRGSARQHRLLAQAAVPGNPPAWVERVLGLQLRRGTLFQVAGGGQWQPQPGGGGKWAGELRRLSAAVWDGASPPPLDSLDNDSVAALDPRRTWMESRGWTGQASFAAGGQLLQAKLSAGQMLLAGGARLRWQEARFEAGATAEAPANFELRAALDPLAIAPMLSRLDPELSLSGDLRVSARMDVEAAQAFRAEIQLQREDGDLSWFDGSSTRAMGIQALRVAFSARDGLWQLEPRLSGRSLGELDGTLALRTSASARWPQPQVPLEGTLRADVSDIGIWSNWVPPGWRLGGRLSTNLGLGGTLAEPQYTGELSGRALSVRNLLQGVNVSEGELRVRLQGETAQIDTFTLRGGEGTARITGSASFGAAPQAQLQLQAQRFGVLGRLDRRLVMSGSSALTLQGQRVGIQGELQVDEGLFDLSRADAPALDSDVRVLTGNGQPPPGASQAAAAAPEAPEPPGPAGPRASTRWRTDMALDVNLGDRLRLRGRGLDTLLKGALRLATPGNRLAIYGSVYSEDGQYAAYGQKLNIERGIVSFDGPVEGARLDVLATRPNLDVQVGVGITGSVQSPRVRLVSEPEMSESEKLSWLVLGRASEGLGRNDTALLQRAAVALLAGEGEAPTDALLRNLGIDEFGLRQSDGDVRETVVTLGKQLSRRWYVGYERSVNATSGTWQLVYRIAQRLTVRAQSGEDKALDVIWTWRFE